jgi:hypothetical protein
LKCFINIFYIYVFTMFFYLLFVNLLYNYKFYDCDFLILHVIISFIKIQYFYDYLYINQTLKQTMFGVFFLINEWKKVKI